MNICLKTYVKENEHQHLVVKLEDRLPERILSPCELTCDFHVTGYDDYYLLALDVSAVLTITCERCLHAFQDAYHHQTVVAVCATEAIAEALMEQYECIVALGESVNLVDVLTDDLHLFSPLKHAHIKDCDVEVSQWIGEKHEILPTTLGL